MRSNAALARRAFGFSVEGHFNKCSLSARSRSASTPVSALALGVGATTAISLILGAAVRFIHFALFDGTLLSPQYYAVDTSVCLIFGFLGFRATRVAQMTTQYRWINTRAGFLRWTRRTDTISGTSADSG